MKTFSNAKLLRIFIGELDKYEKKPLYEVIVNLCRKSNISGATVFKGVLSYGASSIIHKTKILELSADLPLIIEIVDDISKIEELIPKIEELFDKADCGGLITLENIEIIKYTSSKHNH